MNTVLEMLFTASLAATSVTLWTVRVAVTARGSKALGALLAATEAMLFIVAFSKLMTSFDSAYLIIAYGAGVAAGTLAGLTLDGKLNPQLSRVDVFDATGEAIDAIVRAGFPFTRSDGFGSEGKVSVASIVTSEARVRELIDMVGAAGPDSFWTVAPVRRANEVRIPGGHRQVARRSFTVRRHARQVHAADQPMVSPQRTQAAAQV